MTTYIQPATLSIGRLWAGGIITGLVVVFLAFDGVTKIIQVAPVVEASKKLGIAPDSLLGIGIVLVTCTAIPKDGHSRGDPVDWLSRRCNRDSRRRGKRGVPGRLFDRLRCIRLGRTGPARTPAAPVDPPAAVISKSRQTPPTFMRRMLCLSKLI